jgi:phosphoglycolate phosphatase-like HAD superfamily hydrolase
MSHSTHQIIFDFDGVLVDSNAIRIEGFRKLFSQEPGLSSAELEQYLFYVAANGGVSRYRKIRYFYESLRGTKVSDETVQIKAAEYSTLVKDAVMRARAIPGSIEFLDVNEEYLSFAMVSGSDQAELRDICSARRLTHYFVGILGSPTEKEKNIAAIVQQRGWQAAETLYVGDSRNDYEAARGAGVPFVGFGKRHFDATRLSIAVVDSFEELQGYVNAQRMCA